MEIESEKFLNERKFYWEKISNIIKKIHHSGYKSLTYKEALEFPNLYRKICSDYEIAKTLRLAPHTQEYIYKLVQISHNILYATKKNTPHKFLSFFTKEFPTAFLKNWKPIVFITLLFLFTTFLTAMIIYLNPNLASYLLSDDTQEWMKKAYQTTINRSMEDNIVMYAYYIYNNISISFFVFALGVTFGIGTILLILYQGIFIGAIAGVIISSGYGYNFFNFVTAHSAFELLGICLSGGAGLAIGLSMFVTTKEKRIIVFTRKAKEVIPIVFVAAFFISLAAIIEGFISPLNIMYIIKILILITSLLVIILYSYRIFFIKFFRRARYKQKKKKKYKLTNLF